jgi:hypothetical protein
MRRDGSVVVGEVRGGSEPTSARGREARVRLAAVVAEGVALLDLESTSMVCRYDSAARQLCFHPI